MQGIYYIWRDREILYYSRSCAIMTREQLLSSPQTRDHGWERLKESRGKRDVDAWIALLNFAQCKRFSSSVRTDVPSINHVIEWHRYDSSIGIFDSSVSIILLHPSQSLGYILTFASPLILSYLSAELNYTLNGLYIPLWD